MPTRKKLRILIAPLDWGLGHATRCMPIVGYLLGKGHEVVVAGENPVAGILKAAFPEITTLRLEGYRVSYGKRRSSFTLRILCQIPKILRAIHRERRWLGELLRSEHFDLVISDNRYGLHSEEVHSVILTHQLQVISGMGNSADVILRKLHYRLLGKFAGCWVVDNAGRENLGGKLSHPGTVPPNAEYIGWLSQFSAREIGAEASPGQILVLISGPEPTRSLFESELLRQASVLTQYRFIVAAGAPAGAVPETLHPHIAYNAYLGPSELGRAIAHSELVICRSGYSTLMDLAVLRKKALLVPTPGQTEQEYLGKRLHQSGTCLSVRQERLSLERDIPAALKFTGFSEMEGSGREFCQVIDAVKTK